MVLVHLWQRIPVKRERESWMLAQLQAFIGNALGGKSKRGEKKPEGMMFKPPDFLPAWATSDATRAQAQLLDPVHCLLISDALIAGHFRGASWAVQLLDQQDSLDRIHAVAERMRELETDTPD